MLTAMVIELRTNEFMIAVTIGTYSGVNTEEGAIPSLLPPSLHPRSHATVGTRVLRVPSFLRSETRVHVLGTKNNVPHLVFLSRA